ncbi:MAG: type IV pilus twitching motility protein PilT [Bacillus sp. (in: firmicutes)]
MSVVARNNVVAADKYIVELSTKEYSARSNKILDLLNTAVEVDAQDILIIEGELIDFRIRGRLVKQSQLETWDLDDFNFFINKICSQETVSRRGLTNRFESGKDVARNQRTIDRMFFSTLMAERDKSYDFGAAYKTSKMLRVHVCSVFESNPRKEKACIAIRLIPNEIPDLPTLNLPKIVEEIPKKQSGLVLVSGHAGAGKSTTIASLVNRINRDTDMRRAILTIENPIEFVHKSVNGRIIQRQLDDNVPSFKRATEDALREPVNVVVIGELRTVDEMHNALRLAEVGKLVIASIHANGVADTVDRFVGEFDPDIQESIRSRFFENLTGILHQNLEVYNDKQYPVASALVILDDDARRKLRDDFSRKKINEALEAWDVEWAVSRKKAFDELVERGELDAAAENLFVQSHI